jgi:hypothetical protein
MGPTRRRFRSFAERPFFSMSSSHSSKRKPLSYMDAVRIFNELEPDLKDACQNLAQSTVRIMHDFDSIATQLHSLDMQALMPPIKPQSVADGFTPTFAECAGTSGGN